MLCVGCVCRTDVERGKDDEFRALRSPKYVQCTNSELANGT